MYPKCQRCGSKFDPAFSTSRLLCGDCAEIVNGKFTFTAHVSPSASPETLQALGELLTLAAVQAEKGNLTQRAADFAPRGGIYLEPKGSHASNPFDAQDKPQNR